MHLSGLANVSGCHGSSLGVNLVPVMEVEVLLDVALREVGNLSLFAVPKEKLRYRSQTPL